MIKAYNYAYAASLSLRTSWLLVCKEQTQLHVIVLRLLVVSTPIQVI